jgi:hypothetical protein
MASWALRAILTVRIEEHGGTMRHELNRSHGVMQAPESERAPLAGP